MIRSRSLQALLASLCLVACSSKGSDDAPPTPPPTPATQTPAIGAGKSTAVATGFSAGRPAPSGAAGPAPAAAGGAMVPVPAGKALGQEVPAFQIDKTEVTVAEYGKCVAAGACTPTGTTKWCNGADKPDHPINCIDYDQAEKYCAWAGKTLPTEPQWRLAAFGNPPRLHPWGGTEPAIGEASNRYVCGLNQSTSYSGETCPAGARPAGASAVGALDMAGNVSEWLRKGTSPEYNTIGSCNCSPSGGADWQDMQEKRNIAGRTSRISTIGVRCVKEG